MHTHVPCHILFEKNVTGGSRSSDAAEAEGGKGRRGGAGFGGGGREGQASPLLLCVWRQWNKGQLVFIEQCK